MLGIRGVTRVIFRCTQMKPFAFDSEGKPIPLPQQPSLEQPFLKDKLVEDSIKRIYKSSKKEVLQMLNLMDAKIVASNHTLINQSCFRLLNFQKQMSKQEIVSVIQLCVKSQVSNSTFVQHFQNQLLHKLDGPVKQLVEGFYRDKSDEMRKIWDQLEKNSHDVFGILKDPESMRVEEEEEEEDESESENGDVNVEQKDQFEGEMEQKDLKPIQVSTERTEKATKLIKQFGYIGSLLIQLGVQSTNLLKMFQELFLTMGSRELEFETLLQFIRITNHICLKTQQQYMKHRIHYIRRTIKRIKKFQSTFYEKSLPLIKEMLPRLQSADLNSLFREMMRYEISSNKPYSYIFQMFEDYTKLSGYKFNDQTIISLYKLVQKRPKIIAKLDQLQVKQLGSSLNSPGAGKNIESNTPSD